MARRSIVIAVVAMVTATSMISGGSATAGHVTTAQRISDPATLALAGSAASA